MILLVDNSQALEMANIYTNILSSTLDAFASIIANNQNEVLEAFFCNYNCIDLSGLVPVFME